MVVESLCHMLHIKIIDLMIEQEILNVNGCGFKTKFTREVLMNELVESC